MLLSDRGRDPALLLVLLLLLLQQLPMLLIDDGSDESDGDRAPLSLSSQAALVKCKRELAVAVALGML